MRPTSHTAPAAPPVPPVPPPPVQAPPAVPDPAWPGVRPRARQRPLPIPRQRGGSQPVEVPPALRRPCGRRSGQPGRTLPAELDPRRTRRYRSGWNRLLLVGCAALSALILALVSLGWAAYRQLDSAITREHWTIAGARPTPVAGEQNILLLGDDSRDGTHGEYGTVEGVRSDTTIIVHLARDRSATLLWFPRDMLVPVVPRTGAIAGDGRAKLTEVIGLAGTPGLVSTLESLTGLKIDHTVSVNLAGFRAMTDAVGGVTVCVTPLPGGSTRNLRDSMSGWSGRLGENRLDGEQALAFVRTRYALGDERLRILRQQQFLSRLLAAATSTGVLTSPSKLTALLGAAGGALRVDAGLDQAALLRLARQVNDLQGSAVHFVTVPTRVALPADGAVDGLGTIPPHGAVLLADPAGLATALAPLRPVTKTPTGAGSAAADAAPELTPAAVPIAAVRNATGRTGLAAATVDSLRALGFTGPMTTSTAAALQPRTEIHYSPALAAAARALATRLPGSDLVPEATASDSGLVVSLGLEFAGVATSPTTPTPAASGATPPTTTGTTGTAGASGAGGAAMPLTIDTSCTP